MFTVKEICFFVILFNAYYINCYNVETNIRFKGLCYFSLNSADFRKINFDLSRIKSKYVIARYGGFDLLTYLSICELYVDNNVRYNNPCELGNIICFLNASQVFGHSFINQEFNHTPTDVKFNDTDGQLNVTFSEYRQNNSTSFKTFTIMFICSKNETDPEFVYADHLQFYYKWITPSACPINDLVLRNKCIFQPTNKDYRYDLRDLRQEKYYRLSDGETEYFLNICGTIEESACNNETDAVLCTEKRDESPHSVVTDFKHYTLNEIEHGVEITAHTSRKSEKIHIHIVCDDRAVQPFTVTLIHKLTFEIKSYLSCISPYYACIIQHEEQQYDLTPLKRYTANYVVPNDNEYRLRFILNICGYLHDSDLPIAFKGTNIFAYVVDSDGREDIYNYLESFSVVKSGLLELKYTSALTYCSDGKTFRSLLIQFFCSETDNKDDLKYHHSDTDMCTRTLVMHTKHACPIKMYRGQNCQLVERDPELVSYNYTSLRSKSDLQIEHFLNEWSNYTFTMNICGPLYQPCDDDPTAAVCWTKNGKQIVIGRQSSNPISKQGEKYFQMFGDACYFGGPISRVFLYTKCSYIEDVYPRLVELVEGECLFIFEWYVKSACPSENSACKFGSYDVQPLSFVRDNYPVYINATSYFVLNVCRSLIRNANVLCYMDAVACIVNLYDDAFTYKSKTIGRVANNNASVTNALSSIVYSDFSYCMPSAHYSVNYTFHCYPYLVNALITFEKLDEQCRYFFKWKTIYGCTNEQIQLLQGKNYSASCSVRADHANSQQRYSLDKLAGTVWNVTSRSTWNTYSFVICGQTSFKQCTINNGVCVRHMYDRHFESGGELNSRQLEIMDGGWIKVTYRNGDSCWPANAKQRQTVVKLLCSYSSLQNLFVVDELDNCTAIIVFMLQDVCLKQTSCLDYNVRISPNVYLSDIFPSINSHIRTEIGDLILNLCNTSSLDKTDKTFRYLSYANEKNQYHSPPINMKILGFQTVSTVLKNGRLIIKFTEGSMCNSSSVSTSAEVIFKCDIERSLLLPTLIDYNDCHFTFEWARLKMCNMSKLVLFTEHRCFLKDEIMGDEIDLEPFRNKSLSFHDELNNTYFVDLCQHRGYLVKQAGNANYSYGVPTFASVTGHDKNAILFYDHGEPCDEFSLYYAEIRLLCGIPEQNPKVIQSTNCSILVEWKMVNLCPSAPSPHPSRSYLTIIILIVAIAFAAIGTSVAIILILKQRGLLTTFQSSFWRMFGYHTPQLLLDDIDLGTE